MFGIGKQTYNSSMTSIYLFLFILLVNQLLIVNSFRLMHHDSNENEQDEARRATFGQSEFGNAAFSDKSLLHGNNLQSLIKPKFERRFCCMSPLLSGRKRSIRDLTKKQIEGQQA
ncbi:unnamed protein product [Rotaria magnacalcarata]|uniref:Uncharacterized protein n=1 Tax=Rotaria magnacalcarata TaxID=392030 RepID=A0A816ZU91_9BILA|nr:unnamed protein product [Rotaria magnacalcarata]CAF1614473.1 unnamed protein product [Rotaria magnacalcarata]CAF2233997.1 unnamed protein product [Rotaria magnacalcarata]CAF2236209.1 unnamed protein product [Rotaria magnacalcarata]CAF4042288.1 unnamed protein product [Rotaria magnacalcarata]